MDPAAAAAVSAAAAAAACAAPTSRQQICSSNIKWQEGTVARSQRQAMLNQKGCIVWMTGLSGSGKSTVACALDHCLTALNKVTYVLDGDNIRHGLCSDLGFSAADRQENIRRVGEVAKLFADAGLITLVSFISPYRRDRDLVRSLVKAGEFIEVFMNVPLDVCEQRDVKGLYKLARAGKIKGFTGIDDPYEKPETPEITLDCFEQDGRLASPQSMAQRVVQFLADNDLLTARVRNGCLSSA